MHNNELWLITNAFQDQWSSTSLGWQRNPHYSNKKNKFDYKVVPKVPKTQQNTINCTQL